MCKLRFSDGESFDLSGELRIIERYDGFYVVGGGVLIPVDGEEDGKKMIEVVKTRKKKA